MTEFSSPNVLFGTTDVDFIVIPSTEFPGLYDHIISYEGNDQIHVFDDTYSGLLIESGVDSGEPAEDEDTVNVDIDAVFAGDPPVPGVGARVC